MKPLRCIFGFHQWAYHSVENIGWAYHSVENIGWTLMRISYRCYSCGKERKKIYPFSSDD